MTITLNRPPSRADLYLVIELASQACECDEVAGLMAGEVDSVLCQPCRARKRWNELLEVVDEV